MRPLALSRELRRRLRRLARTTWANGALSATVAALVLGAALDYLVHFGFALRTLLLALTLSAAGGAWRLMRRRQPPATTATEAAIVVERLRRSRDSLFLTGVEVEENRAHGDDALAARVADRAAETVTETIFTELDRRALRRAQRILAGALFIVAALTILAPETTLRHLGRVLLPLARIAPATATRLAVRPGDAAVREGDNLTIHLTVTGALPFFAEVEALDETGTISRIAMLPAGGDTESRHFTAIFENIRGPLRYRVSAGDAISFPYAIDCLQPPHLAMLRVRLRPPSYLGEGDTVLVNPTSLRVPRGSSLEYELAASRPLADATFSFATANGVETGAATTDGANARWRQTPSESGMVECELTGANGVGGPAGIGLELTLVEDAPPELIVLSPQLRAKVVVSEEIPFLAVLRDDHRLRDCRIWVAISAETETLWRTITASGDTARLAFDLPLEDFVLEPGDVVHVRLEARDHNPAGRATSRSRSIQVIPYARYYRYAEKIPPMLAALAPKLRAFIERQRALIERTSSALGSDRELLVVSVDEERLRADLRAELERNYELMRQEDPLNRDPHVLDEICMKAEAAAREMAKAVSRLEKNEGEAGLGHERAALAELMKSLAALLVIVTPDAPPQSGEVEPTEEQFEDLPRPEETREATASPETSPDEQQTEAAQSLLEEAKRLRRDGKATPAELERLAAEAEKIADAEENPDQGRQPGEEGTTPRGEQQAGGRRGDEEQGQGRQTGDEGASPRDGQQTGGRRGDEEQGQGRQTGDEGASPRGGQQAGQPRREDTEATGQTGAGDGRPTGQPGRATSGERATGQTASGGVPPRRTGESGRLINENAEQWRAMSASGDRRERARRLNEIAARLRRLARQGRTGNMNSGQLVDTLDALITVLTEIRDVAEARQLARSMLDELLLDPESIPTELRDLVRRYFELLNR